MKEREPPRKLKVDISELMVAMDDASYEHSYYLDVENGRILFVTDETKQQLDDIYEEMPDEKDGEEEADIEACLKHLNIPDWQKDALREADEVEKGFGTRRISIPHVESSDAYGDMEDFSETVQNPRLKDRLLQALSMSHPFRRFKDILVTNSNEQERWFQFKETSQRERILEWLEDEGIEPVTDGA